MLSSDIIFFHCRTYFYNINNFTLSVLLEIREFRMKLLFAAGDYAVFALMLVISLGIGIYYGVRERMSRKKDVQNYLMGGRLVSKTVGTAG